MKYDDNGNPVYTCPICRDGKFVHPLKEDGSPNYSKHLACECQKKPVDQQPELPLENK